MSNRIVIRPSFINHFSDVLSSTKGMSSVLDLSEKSCALSKYVCSLKPELSSWQPGFTRGESACKGLKRGMRVLDFFQGINTKEDKQAPQPVKQMSVAINVFKGLNNLVEPVKWGESEGFYELGPMGKLLNYFCKTLNAGAETTNVIKVSYEYAQMQKKEVLEQKENKLLKHEGCLQQFSLVTAIMRVVSVIFGFSSIFIAGAVVGGILFAISLTSNIIDLIRNSYEFNHSRDNQPSSLPIQEGLDPLIEAYMHDKEVYDKEKGEEIVRKKRNAIASSVIKILQLILDFIYKITKLSSLIPGMVLSSFMYSLLSLYNLWQDTGKKLMPPTKPVIIYLPAPQTFSLS